MSHNHIKTKLMLGDFIYDMTRRIRSAMCTLFGYRIDASGFRGRINYPSEKSLEEFYKTLENRKGYFLIEKEQKLCIKTILNSCKVNVDFSATNISDVDKNKLLEILKGKQTIRIIKKTKVLENSHRIGDFCDGNCSAGQNNNTFNYVLSLDKLDLKDRVTLKISSKLVIQRVISFQNHTDRFHLENIFYAKEKHKLLCENKNYFSPDLTLDEWKQVRIVLRDYFVPKLFSNSHTKTQLEKECEVVCKLKLTNVIETKCVFHLKTISNDRHPNWKFKKSVYSRTDYNSLDVVYFCFTVLFQIILCRKMEVIRWG